MTFHARAVARLVAAVVLLVACQLVCRSANAEGQRVAALNAEPVLVAALSRTLSPWNVEVVFVSVPHVASDVKNAKMSARDIAVSTPAAAVVWTSSTAAGDASDSLWLYDASNGEVVVRPLHVASPLDEATAASIALSVKTLLRATSIAPPREQVARPAGQAAKGGEPAAHDTAHSDRSAAPPPAPPAPPLFRVDVTNGMRFLVHTPVHLEPRVDGAFSLWPRWFGGRAGIALGGGAGPRVPITTDRFSGKYADNLLRAGARYRAPVDPVTLEIEVGGALHFTSITGDLLPSNVHVTQSQLDPSLDIALTASVPLASRIDLGLATHLAWFLRHQRYTVGPARVLEIAPLEPSVGLRLVFAID